MDLHPATTDPEYAGQSGGESPPRRNHLRHEILGVVTATAALLLGLALVSAGNSQDNLIGPVGQGLASMVLAAFGWAGWLLPAELGLLTVRLFQRTPLVAAPHTLDEADRLDSQPAESITIGTAFGPTRVASTLIVVLVGCVILHLAGASIPAAPGMGEGMSRGGAIGEVMGEVLRSLLGTVGATVIAGATLLIVILLRSPATVFRAFQSMGQAFRAANNGAHNALQQVKDAWAEARALELADGLNEHSNLPEGSHENPQGGPQEDPEEDPENEREKSDASKQANESDTEDPQQSNNAPTTTTTRKKTTAKATKDDGPRIVAPIAKVDQLELPPAVTKKAKVPTKKKLFGGKANEVPFELPPMELLEPGSKSRIRVNAETLRNNAARLVEKLEAYGVKGRVDEIHPGPVVTMYEFEPQSGTKVSKIAGLADDLAMALAAQKVRIVAPIPGKARVGFELPNDERQTVYLRQTLQDRRWDNQKADLPMALGEDIAGQPVYCDLARMPHLLVAGATGAGKSVGLNVMLTSLLTKKTPEEVRLLMIDPKVVELAVFDGIPHMLLPVVTDMKKAALALKWAVDEMERRYQLFADAGARNIKSYNDRVQKVLNGDLAPEKLKPKKPPKAMNADTFEDAQVQGEELEEKPPEKLPYVVVVVDEFADLMMVAAKDVESAIARLAQKARAAGIHVILATQRPSVDVITGMIKANFPARMAFKVSQREDSKTILGRNGAEHLLGMGDMLMIPPGSSDLQRVHCSYVSEDEVRDVCDHLRAQAKPVYDEEILKPRDDEDEEGSSDNSDDPVYDRAVRVVAEAGYCSISHIQRKLSVGYNKAAKLVEEMEKQGVVGPPTSKAGGRREVLIQNH